MNVWIYITNLIYDWGNLSSRKLILEFIYEFEYFRAYTRAHSMQYSSWYVFIKVSRREHHEFWMCARTLHAINAIFLFILVQIFQLIQWRIVVVKFLVNICHLFVFALIDEDNCIQNPVIDSVGQWQFERLRNLYKYTYIYFCHPNKSHSVLICAHDCQSPLILSINFLLPFHL